MEQKKEQKEEKNFVDSNNSFFWRNNSILSVNVKQLDKFYSYILDRVAESTAKTQMHILSRFARDLKKDFKVLTIADLQQHFKNREAEPTTIKHEKLILRKFYQWLDIPKLIDWLSINKKIKHKIKYKEEDLITRDDVKKLMEACREIRNKALIAFLFDSGCRSGELVNMNIKDINFDLNPPMATLNGKTGMRQIPCLMMCQTILKKWINEYPITKHNPKTPNSPLWISFTPRNKYGRLLPSALNEILIQISKDAGLKKHVNPHLFRHSRATELEALGMSHAEMNVYFGWTPKSNMALHYSNSGVKRVTDKMLQIHGKAPIEEQQPIEIDELICSRCKEPNDITAVYCSKCGECLKTILSEDESLLIAMRRSTWFNLIKQSYHDTSEPMDFDKILQDYVTLKANIEYIKSKTKDKTELDEYKKLSDKVLRNWNR